MSRPLLSVCLITYNQNQYIREALESIMMQRVNFAWELIIADDCSTDGTKETLLEYKKNFPDLIKLILHENNVGAEKNWHELMAYPKSKYVAYLEGDDYWTDRDKLQLQVDFLEKNPDYAICFHPTKVFYEGGEDKQTIWPNLHGKTELTVNELLKENLIPSNSVMYRRQKYDGLPMGIMPGDWYLHLYNAQFGRIDCIDRVMSAYRRHSGGVWWDSYKNPDQLWSQHGVQRTALYVELLKIYGDSDKLKEIIHEGLAGTLGNLIAVDKKHKKKLLGEVLVKYPEVAEPVIAIQYHQLQTKEASLQRKDREIDNLKGMAIQKDQEIIQKDQEIKMIKLSRFWKMRNTVARLIGRKVI